MGSHIYIKNKADDCSVGCPWYRVGIYGKKINSLEEFKEFLQQCKSSDDDAIKAAEELLNNLSSSEPMVKAEAIKKVVNRYSNNLGFINKKKESCEEEACVDMQEWEVGRLKHFAMDDDLISEFLSIFDEVRHYVLLG